MIFNFEKLILWFKDGKKRDLTFQPNKVNVITGESGTGKSAILQIIDYCFFASHSKISESRINENVNWYGITFHINDKKYTICRSSLSEGKVTDNYYFSSSGNVPESPEVNSDEKTIKSLLETEFGIDRNVRIPFGGKLLKAGSRISLRYFLMFTTISEDIITNSSVFFDKQNESRYREALPRIFDIAVGIDDIENVLRKEEKQKLVSEKKKLERRQNRVSAQRDDFLTELGGIIRRAKEYGLISADLKLEDAVSVLSKTLTEFSSSLTDTPSDEYSQLKKESYHHAGVVRNLKRLQHEYSDYKKSLKQVEDSLKPVSFLRSKKDELIKTSIYEELIEALESDLKSLKKDVTKRAPIDINISDLICEHERKLLEVTEKINALPQDVSTFNNDKEKYFFMGELKAKLELYNETPQYGVLEAHPSLDDLQDQIDEIQVADTGEKREIFIKFLEELIQKYFSFVDSTLENYSDYHPVFDYTKKALLLRKPYTDFIENVGSSSNHMFLHLFLFLGLHEAIQRKNAPFVPSYLVIDQPSRPYWGDGKKKKEKLDHGDEAKVRKAFELLDSFVNQVVVKLNKNCQLIVFEHVPPSTWEGLEHVHLVEEFLNGNALVPEKYQQK
jgi:energy-coupling factor transporter ATP-binding protein EcfA2